MKSFCWVVFCRMCCAVYISICDMCCLLLLTLSSLPTLSSTTTSSSFFWDWFSTFMSTRRAHDNDTHLRTSRRKFVWAMVAIRGDGDRFKPKLRASLARTMSYNQIGINYIWAFSFFFQHITHKPPPHDNRPPPTAQRGGASCSSICMYVYTIYDFAHVCSIEMSMCAYAG